MNFSIRDSMQTKMFVNVGLAVFSAVIILFLGVAAVKVVNVCLVMSKAERDHTVNYYQAVDYFEMFVRTGDDIFFEKFNHHLNISFHMTRLFSTIHKNMEKKPLDQVAKEFEKSFPSANYAQCRDMIIVVSLLSSNHMIISLVDNTRNGNRFVLELLTLAESFRKSEDEKERQAVLNKMYNLNALMDNEADIFSDGCDRLSAWIISLVTKIMTGIVLSMALVVFVFIKKMMRPIKKLKEASSAMADGNLDYDIDTRGKDELGLLAKSFDHMRHVIREKIIELQQEISERRKTEEALRESEKKYRDLIDNYNSPISVYDTDLNIMIMNRAAAENLGGKPEDFFGKKLYECFPDRAEELIERHRKVIESGIPADFEDLFEFPSGKIWFWTNVQPLKDENDEVYAIQGIGYDITERKKTEEALRESEEKYRLLIENVGAAVIYFDKELKIVMANNRVIKDWGMDLETLQGKSMYDLFPRSEAARYVQRWSKIAAEDKVGEFEDLIEIRGEKRWMESRIEVIKDEKGDHIGYIDIVYDITERKRAEEENARMEAQLQQAYKMEAIGTLAGGIAHDFNNILSAVIGYTEISMLQAQEGSKIHRNLQEVLKAGDRAKDLVQQILTFSRQTEKELKPVQTSIIVKEALKLLRASLPTTIEIHQDMRSDSLILGDPTQIHQILMNLCTNAGHAMQEKGGALEVSLENVEFGSELAVRHPDLKSGPYLNLTVSDTGHGMPSDVLERIYDPFFTTKEKGEGTGMGLSVVHGIVKSYGGTIDAYSELGKGTRFKVFFPIIERRIEPDKREEKPILRGTERILFIDDEQPLVNMGKQLLESLGYKVTTRNSSTEALALFKAQPEKFDLVITDMTMPNMTGDKLAEELIGVRPDIPIILCTGFSNRITKDKALEMGIGALVMKPIVRHEIANTIRQVLDKK